MTKRLRTSEDLHFWLTQFGSPELIIDCPYCHAEMEASGWVEEADMKNIIQMMCEKCGQRFQARMQVTILDDLASEVAK